MPAPTSTPPPPTLGRYRVIRRLGAGGMAEVFLAKSMGAEGIEKILVVKRVLPTFARSAKFRAMFVDEAKVATRLNHPNIVQVYGFEQVRDDFLLAMEFVDGLDLGRLVAASKRIGRRIPYGIAAYVVAEVAKGLDYAHNRKDEHGKPLEIVHRDVSPQNVLLSYEGTVKVADFGIARAKMVSEETGVIKGKFAYMSPEQSRGLRVDRRSDVYSLGVLLSELLMGRPMYPGQAGLDVLEQVRQGKVTPPREVDPGVPADLDAIVRKATSFERDERYQTSRAFAGAISQFLHQQADVYDGAALEQLIGDLSPRDVTSPDAEKRGVVGAVPEREMTTAPTMQAPAPVEREVRERRHVVVVAGRVRSRSSTEAESSGDTPSSESAAATVGAEAARVLADIAYKSDAVLDWTGGTEQTRRRFRFVLGLGRPTVHDPLRAVRVALDVLDALAGLSPDLASPLSASIGLSRGVVSTSRDATGRLVRYEPVGTVLEVAERLADDGRAAEVLAAGEVYRMARRDFAFDEKSVREVTIGGNVTQGTATRGVRAYPLRGARTREERAASALGRHGKEGFVGRELELRALAEAYHEVLSTARSSFVTVVGDLGVGKTALVSSALAQLEPSPRILRVECSFGVNDVPLAATADLVREICGIEHDAPPDVVRAKLRETSGALVVDIDDADATAQALEPLFAPPPDGRSPEDGAERVRAITRSVRTLLGALATRGPFVLVIDALQWIDAASLELLADMTRRSYEVPLLGLFVTRPEPHLEKVLGSVQRIDVAELDEEERSELIRARFDGASVPADVERAIVERAGGNPFFISELVEALLERGVVAIEGKDGQRRVTRRSGPIALPSTLEGAIAARLSELPDAERQALRWLAAAGPGLRAGDLAALAGEDLGEPLSSLQRRGLVHTRPGGAFAFQSAVVRHVAYESADASDRLRMHRRIGAHFSTFGGAVPPARIARHLERAGDHAAAADAYLSAAAAARAVYSNRDALRFYARALSLLAADAPQRFAAHEGREQILRGMGRRRDQLFELEAMRAYADRIGTPAMRATAYNRLVRFELDGSHTAGVDALLKRALESAIEAADPSAEVEALRLTAQLAREQGDVQKAVDATERALARAGLAPERLAARGSVLVQRGILLRRMGRVDDALEAIAEAIVIFRRLGLKRNEAQAANSAGVALAAIGAFEDAIVLIRSSIALDREIGDRFHLGMKLSNVGQLYAELGDFDRAFSFLHRALAVFQALDDRGGRVDALSALAELVLEHLDDAETAVGYLDDARAAAERTDDRYDLARERTVRSLVELHREKFVDAETSARDAAGLGRAAGLVGYELLGLARQAEALAHLGRSDEAITAASKAIEAVRHGQVERAERIYLSATRALKLSGNDVAARQSASEGLDFIETRAAAIRDPELRERYLATPVVKGIRSTVA